MVQSTLPPPPRLFSFSSREKRKPSPNTYPVSRFVCQLPVGLTRSPSGGMWARHLERSYVFAQDSVGFSPTKTRLVASLNLVQCPHRSVSFGPSPPPRIPLLPVIMFKMLSQEGVLFCTLLTTACMNPTHCTSLCIAAMS